MLRIWIATFIVGTVNDYIFMLLPVVDNFWQAIFSSRDNQQCNHHDHIGGSRLGDADSSDAAVHSLCVQWLYVLVYCRILREPQKPQWQTLRMA